MYVIAILLMKYDLYLQVKLRGQYCIRVSPNPPFGNFHGNNLAGNGDPVWKEDVSE